MAKGVLGNDPFQRGAAAREPRIDLKPAVEVRPVAKAETAAPPPAARRVKAARRASSTQRPGVDTGAPGLQAAQPFAGEPAAVPGPPPRSPPLARPAAEQALVLLEAAREQTGRALRQGTWAKGLRLVHGLLQAARAGLGTGAPVSLDVYGKDAALGRDLEPLLSFLYERYWRVSVQGAANVPAGPAILVANHSGALPYDGPMVHTALGRERPDLRESRWLVEDQIFYSPVMGTLLNRMGAVRACPENAVRLLEEKRPLIVFPEGFQGLSKPFAQRYQLKRFGRGGFVKLALRTGAPIVPVAVVGAEESAPLVGRLPGQLLGLSYLPLTPLGPLPLPAKWTLRFGLPLDTQGLGPSDADDLATVHRLTERTRESIQGMLRALLDGRRSVFRG